MSSSPAPGQPISSNPVRTGPSEQAAAMDRMYRLTRHIYDLTRAYYLLGRDRMLARVATGPNTATVEVGCGTARNLIKLARRPAPGLLYGLDASHEMLETAAASITRAGVEASSVDAVIMGNVVQAGVGPNPARQAAEAAGIPLDTPREVLDGWTREGRLFCACEDPRMPLPEEMSWGTLVSMSIVLCPVIHEHS